MHPRSALAIARKDIIDILLNKSTVVVLIMPILTAVLFLLVSNLVGSHITNILVYDPGQSPLVQQVSGYFDATKITEAASPNEVTAAFRDSQNAAYDVGLIIPANFESALRAGGHPQVSLYANEKNMDPRQAQALQVVIISYARDVANPQPPLALATTAINPPPTTNVGSVLQNAYSGIALLVSFMIGTSLMPGLLIEEKERKTLRMLMVTPASFTDVIMGKLLAVLIYQLLVSLLALAVIGGFMGQIPLVLLYTLLGACFSLALGLLCGGIFSTASAAGAVGGILSLIYIIPGLFAGPLGQVLGSSGFTSVMKVFPTYYMADGIYNAILNQGSPGSAALDIGVIVGSTLALVAITVWVLRRQASVTAAI